MKKSILSMAVCGALGLGMSVAFTSVAIAQDSDVSDDSEVVYVTGSRIPISVTDAPRPITLLSKEDMEIRGINDLTQGLRSLTFNSLGSFRDQSGSSFGQIALVDLRGLGADRTAVLINGRRVGSNPLTGSSAVDLNTIPFSAIERVEVLTDSASSVYGADAIGGVINIIMKQDFNGLDMSIGHDSPTRDDATTDRFDFTIGQSGERGSVLFSLDYYKRNPVFDKDRDYSKVKVTQPSSGFPVLDVDTIGVSAGGNTGFDVDFTRAFNVGDCPTDTYIPITQPFGLPGDGCGFGYADISMQTGGLERVAAFIDSRYELDDENELYFENRITKSDTFGRFAPAVGFFRIAADAPLNTTGEEFDLFHRFTGHGNRDDNISIVEIDNVIGVNGSLFDDSINYDVFARRYAYDARSEGDTYVIQSIIEDLVADGSYNFVNPLAESNVDAVQQSSATLSRDISTEYKNIGLSLNGTLGDLTGGSVGWAAGIEWASEEYQDQYDNFREAGNVIGSAGNTSAGDRERWAAFSEVQLPLLDNFLVTLAGRFDDYNDFGSEFSPSLAVKWDPLSALTVRASAGQGFKAPNLGDLYQELSQSFEGVVDRVRCEEQQRAADPNAPFDINACPNPQTEEYTGGNPDLLAETSTSFNVGFITNPFTDFNLSLDYWSVDIDDAVQTLELEDVFALEDIGLPPGVIINRGPTAGGVRGAVRQCSGPVRPPNCGVINVFGNLAKLEVAGVDLKVQYDFDTSFGDFSARSTVSHYVKYDDQPTSIAPVADRRGTADYPDTQFTAGLTWSTDPVTVAYSLKWISAHEGGSANEAYDAWQQHDITATWRATSTIDLAFGVRNLLDEDPSVSTISGWTASTSETSLDLYDVAGRTFQLTASLRLD